MRERISQSLAIPRTFAVFSRLAGLWLLGAEAGCAAMDPAPPKASVSKTPTSQ
jgi:hypothetical protein